MKDHKKFLIIVGVLLVVTAGISVVVMPAFRWALLMAYAWTALLALGVVLYIRKSTYVQSTALRNTVKSVVRDASLSLEEIDNAVEAVSRSLAGLKHEVEALRGEADARSRTILDKIQRSRQEGREARNLVVDKQNRAVRDTTAILEGQQKTAAELNATLNRLRDLSVEIVSSIDGHFESHP